MAKYRHLRNAPIREAVIDFRINLSIDLDKLRSLASDLKEDFPTCNDIRFRTFGLEVEMEQVKTSAVDHGLIGFRLEDVDSKYVLQLKTDGFTFSRLPPYLDWEELSGKAKQYWNRYIDLAGPQSHVTRMATRFINVMELPLPILDFKEYLITVPDVPESLPQEIAGFFTRIVIVNRELDAAAVVVVALEDVSREKAPIVLDIDAYKNLDISTFDVEVWNTLESLRVFKNRVFFESITEKTAELFQ